MQIISPAGARIAPGTQIKPTKGEQFSHETQIKLESRRKLFRPVVEPKLSQPMGAQVAHVPDCSARWWNQIKLTNGVLVSPGMQMVPPGGGTQIKIGVRASPGTQTVPPAGVQVAPGTSMTPDFPHRNSPNDGCNPDQTPKNGNTRKGTGLPTQSMAAPKIAALQGVTAT